MPCIDRQDPADFVPGVIDPIDDPSPPTSEITIDDVMAVKDPDGTWWARFPINITNINYVDAIQFNYATANGTGSAGTHYVNTSGLHTIPAGNAGDTIDVQVLAPAGASGQKTFFLNLSSPSNCVLDDTQGKCTIDYGDPGGGPPPPVDHTKDPSYVGFPRQACDSANNNCTIYDQFKNCYTEAACTAFASAAAMSALYYRATGHFQRFDAWKLWNDLPLLHHPCSCAAGVTRCGGTNPVNALKYVRDTGIKMIDSGTFKKFGSYTQFTDNNNANLVKKIKQGIVDHGLVYMMSEFYSSPDSGWNRCKDCNGGVLRSPENTDPFGSHDSHCTELGQWHDADLVPSPAGGHAWILTGWNNNTGGGAFEIQSSHGTDWGNGGRCFIPYAQLRTNSHWAYWHVTYGG